MRNHRETGVGMTAAASHEHRMLVDGTLVESETGKNLETKSVAWPTPH